MLPLVIPAMEFWDEANECFINTKEQHLNLEHSLLSLSKWESKWCKPFLKKENRTSEEIIDYIRCMTINSNVDPMVYYHLTNENVDEVRQYIDAPMTATTVPDKKNRTGPREQITSELIYYWMITFNIPFSCEKWHLNRLLMLIRVCDYKQQPPKKMSANETLARYKAINDARCAQLKSKG